MKRLTWLIAAVMLSFGGLVFGQQGLGKNPGSRASDATAADPERFIVTFHQFGPAAREAVLGAGGTVLRELPEVDAIAAKLPAAARQALHGNGNTKRIEVDAKRYPMALWNNLTLPSGEIVPYGIQMVQADQLSSAGIGNRKVCIIDSGFYRSHEDLQKLNVTATPDIGTGDPFKDDTAHGTHVAGTIAAIGGNGLGVVGVNSSGALRLHIVKVFGDYDGSWSYSSDLVAAVSACRSAGANVISMSLGGPSLVTAEQTAFAAAEAAGVLSIAAAGNDGTTGISYPGGYSSVMSVAAVDADEAVADFSQKNTTVEIAAPGVAVLSTVPEHSESTLNVNHTTYRGEPAENAANSTGVTGTLVNGGLCQPTDPVQNWSGKVVLCQRGGVSFGEKAQKVQDSGGSAAIIYNNAIDGDEGLFMTLGTFYSRIPVLGLTRNQGEQIVANGYFGLPAAVVNSTWKQVLNSYEPFNGTSMATPHVSAVAAMVWSYNPSWTNAQIRNALTATARDKGTAGRDNSYGFGIVQAKAARDYLCASTGQGCSTPTPAPEADPQSACITDTNQADFGIQWDGFASANAKVDVQSNVGSVQLADIGTVETVDQATSTDDLLLGSVFNSTSWAAQTFTAAVTGTMKKVDTFLYCDTCSGTDPNVIISIRATSAGLPTGADLATATIGGFSNYGWKRATFATPVTLTAGVKYAIVVRSASNRTSGNYRWIATGTCGAVSCTLSNPYTGGQLTSSTNSGASFSNVVSQGKTTSGFFKTFISTGSVAYPASASIVSSTKDARTSSVSWGTLSWTAATPAATSVSFEAAASNSPAGPFTFTGPFANGASLSQFNGKRYLRYRATLATNLATNTPILQDVQLCYQVLGVTTLKGTVRDSATALPISGATVTAGASSTTTNASGAYQFAGIAAGTYTVTAAAGGYVSDSATVVIADGTSVTRDFALSAPLPVAGCLTDTTAAHFQSGVATSLDLTSAPGDVKLSGTSTQALDQQQTTAGTNGTSVSSTAWAAQTFRAGTAGALTRVDVSMFANSPGVGNVIVEIRSVSGGLPTSTVLATTTIAGFTGGIADRIATFATPASVTAGTTYAVVLRAASGTAAFTRACAGTGSGCATAYGNGSALSSTNSGGAWSTLVLDHVFKTYVTTSTFSTSGNLVSSTKDSNPGSNPQRWGSLSWTAFIPANTSVQFQVAASNNANGPFTFVGPNGTASTFFTTSGASLAQFSGNRYLKYRAVLSTTNAGVTPTISDVTLCYDNTAAAATSLQVAAASGSYGGTTSLSATLTAGGQPVNGVSVTFTVNGNSFAGNTAVTNASGVATVSNVSLAGIDAGTYPDAVGAAFAGSSYHTASSGSSSLTVARQAPVVAVSGGPFTYNGTAHAATATAIGLGGVNVSGISTFTYNGSPNAPVNAGSYAVVATFISDDPNYSDATGNGSITIGKATPSVAVSGGPFTYDATAHGASAVATGVEGVVVSGTSTFTYNGSPSAPANAGTYAVVATFTSTDANYANATGSGSITIGKATPTVTVGGGPFVYNGTARSASANASGVSAENVSGTFSFSYAPGSPVNVGSYAVTANFTSTNANYTNASGTGSITITPATPTVTVTGGPFVYDATAKAAAGVARGAGGATIAGSFTFTYGGSAITPVDAGTYAVVASFTSDDPNYVDATGNGSITIGKATPSVAVSGGPFTYDGVAHAASANAAGVNGTNVSGSFTFTYNGSSTVPTNAGTYAVIATFTSTVANYANATGSGSITIGKATPAVNVGGGPFVYNGTARSASATAAGISGESVSGTFSYTYAPTSPVNAGTYAVIATFTSTNGNYSNASGNGSLTITPATPAIVVTGGPFVYDGTAKTATASAKGVGGATVAGSFILTYGGSATAPVNAGTYPVAATFTSADANYLDAAGAGSIAINPRPLTVRADDKSKQYSDPMPEFTVTYALLPGDVLGGVVSFATAANALSSAGTYAITPGGLVSPNYSITFAPGTLTVTPEDATLVYTGDSLKTATGGNNGTATVTLAAAVEEAQDGSLGNTLTGKTVRFSIFDSNNVNMTTPDHVATATIGGASNVAVTTIALPADNYTVSIELMANAQYATSVETAATTVVTPEAGLTSGGGWVVDTNGSRGNFAFTSKYLPRGNPQGNSLYVYKADLDLSAWGAPAGVRSYNILIKSNSMAALALTNDATPKTATFTGKNNVFAVDRVTGLRYNIGAGLNLQFQVDVTDVDDKDTADRYALRVWNTTGTYKVVGTYTPSGANTSQVALSGGNVQVK